MADRVHPLRTLLNGGAITMEDLRLGPLELGCHRTLLKVTRLRPPSRAPRLRSGPVQHNCVGALGDVAQIVRRVRRTFHVLGDCAREDGSNPPATSSLSYCECERSRAPNSTSMFRSTR